ncbi:MAG: glycosyltransferase, partial [Desulfobacteraceae bacterium]
MGGVETWLVQVLRRLDRKRFHVDILTNTEEECFFDQEVEALGCRLLPCLHPSQPVLFARNFFRILRKFGPYDVVHSHVFRYSGFIMRLADAAGVPFRLAQSHNTSENRRLTFFRRGYNWLMTKWLNNYATHLLAVSPAAATALFGHQSLSDPRLCIIPPAIDFIPFRDNFSPEKIRASLGLSQEEKILGHVGRFEEQKNHLFLLKVIHSLRKKYPNTRCLLVGDGPLRPEVEARAKELGLADRITFAGVRNDVPGLLKGAIDILLFPSKWEGFGRVILEAQAAGLPCLVSDVVPSDVDVVKPLVRRLSLSQTAEVWAQAVWDMLQSPLPISQAEALRQVEESPFNI